jgi:hypothetical protein
MDLVTVGLAAIVLTSAAVFVRAGIGPAAAFVAAGCALLGLQAGMLHHDGRAADLPLGASLAFLCMPLLPALMAALLYPPEHGR